MKRDPISELRNYAESLIREIEPGEARRVVAMALARTPGAKVGWVRRTATAMAAFLAFGGSNLGLALASDPAVPGDLLYSVDRFYDNVALRLGLKDSLIPERLDEATVLAERGRLSKALEVTQAALGELDQLGNVEARNVLDQVEQDLLVAEQHSRSLEEAPGYQMTSQVREDAYAFLSVARLMLANDTESESPAAIAQQLANQARRLAEGVAAEAQRIGQGASSEEHPGGPPIDTPAGEDPGPPSSLPSGAPEGTPAP